MRLLAIAALLLFTGSAFADASGANIKEWCEEKYPTYCLGYIYGMIDAHRGFLSKGADRKNYYCVPDKSTFEQVRLIVVKYMTDHPERLHYAGESLVVDALHNAFPCPAK